MLSNTDRLLKQVYCKLNIFLPWCEAQPVTQVQDVTPDLLRRFLLAMAETRNPGGAHGIYRGVGALYHLLKFPYTSEGVLQKFLP